MKEVKDLYPGEEQWEEYYSHIAKGTRVQYDFRDYDGNLYSAIGRTLQIAKEKALAYRRKTNV